MVFPDIFNRKFILGVFQVVPCYQPPGLPTDGVSI